MSDLVQPKSVDVTYETEEPVLYEADAGIAWVTMNRPSFNNSQNGQMTYALDDAFQRATHDDAVKCIVLAGAGISVPVMISALRGATCTTNSTSA